MLGVVADVQRNQGERMQRRKSRLMGTLNARRTRPMEKEQGVLELSMTMEAL